MGDTLIFDLVARDKSFDQVMGNASKSAIQLADKVDAAGKDISQGLERSFKEAGKSGIYLEKAADGSVRAFEQASKKIRGDLKETEEAAKDAGQGIGESLTEGLSSALDSMGGGPLASLTQSFSAGKAGLLGAGLALGGLLMDGISDAIARRKVGAMISAQTGQAAGSASRMGNIAGDVFASSFGESIEQVGEAMTAVFQNKLIDPSAADAAIAEITSKIITVSDVMGEEAAKVSRSVRTMMVNGVASNISQAMDMITHATQQGLNSAGDLLDTIDEYSVQFSRMGLSGQESFGLIGQALKAGARDTDIAADAIKEFSIRAQDGSVMTKRGFETIGLDARVMGERVAAGGDTANQALRDTLNALQAMPPGVERSTAAVDLFGTKAEDMGEALYHMDLDNAAQQFGDFAGSVTEAANRMGEGVTGAEKLSKGFDNAKADVGDFLFELGSLGESDAMTDMTDKAKMFALAVEKWKSTGSTEWLDELKVKFPEMAGAIDIYIGKHKGEVDAHNAVTSSVQTEIDTLDELIAKQQEAAGVALSARDAERNFQEAIDSASEAVKTNGRNIDNNTAKGRANNEALDNLAKAALANAAAMSQNGRSTKDVADKMVVARRRFIEAAVQMGYSRAQARALANQLGLIPRNIRINVSARTQAAAANVRAFQRAVNNLRDKTITISTYVRGANINNSGGRQYVGMASGGPVKANELYRVGEQGEEWFVPKQDGQIIPNDVVQAASKSLSPFGALGAAPSSAPAVQLLVTFSGSSSMAEAFKTDVRTGKIKLTANGASVQVG